MGIFKMLPNYDNIYCIRRKLIFNEYEKHHPRGRRVPEARGAASRLAGSLPLLTLCPKRRPTDTSGSNKNCSKQM